MSGNKLLRRVWCVLAFLIVIDFPTVAQTREQHEWLERFALEQAQTALQQRVEAESLAALLGIPVREESPDGVVIELQKIVNGEVYYYRTHNINAAHTISTSKVWSGGGFGFSLTGAGDTLGIWDANKARQTHQELNGRVIYSDAGTTTHYHATHVAGTMIASGVSASAKGMAPQAVLKSYNWTDDFSEMATAASAGMKVSNHSYGYITGWYTPNGSTWHWYGAPGVSATTDYKFGYYSSDAQAVDNLAYNAPHYLIVKSAGNDRNGGPSSQPVTHTHSGSGSFTCVHDLNGAPSGYDCISGFGLSKNVLTVGAVNDIPGGYTTPSGVVMSSFSSWGPTDDGRIKPDIVGNGVSVYSSTNTSNTAYATYSGTSMSSPNVSGSLGLLLELRRSIAGNNPYWASTLKALVIHTADEAGPAPGPDYMFGWGLMNTLTAAQVMRADSVLGLNKHIRELVLGQGQTIDVQVSTDGSQPLRATICWTDPAGTPPPASVDPTDIMLVNDLDLRILQGMTTHAPWILDPANPSAAATTGDNIRDNVEQVHIASPGSGTYTVRITHKGTLTGGSQAVSLVITGGTFEPMLAVHAPNGGEQWPIGSTQNITWGSSGITGNVKIELSRDGGASFPEVLFANTANDGTEAWTVTRPVSTTARVRISSVSTPSIADTSDTMFSIVQPTITLIAPNGGESWTAGTSQTIQWTSAYLTGNIRVELSRDGGATYPEMLFASTPNDGNQAWTVTAPATSDAKIRLVSLAYPSVIDESDAAFAIVVPSITVISPDGDEVWPVGSSQTIQWTSSNVTGNVKIELSRDGGTTYPEMLFANTPNDGSESWSVTSPATSLARVRVTSLSYAAATDASDTTFAIVQPSITVTSPNGGETWVVGDSALVTWSSVHSTGNVHVLLSRDGGTTFPETLAANIADAGLVSCVVTGPLTTQARVRVVSVTMPAVADISDANFEIADAGITVLAPNGGEVWIVDSSMAIQWTSSNVSGAIMIELSRDGGVSYDTLFASIPNSGFQSWTVTRPTTDQMKIRISSTTIPSIADVGDGMASIHVARSMSVGEGWNMLSLPVTVPAPLRSVLFPSAVSPGFAFNPLAGYTATDSLRYGTGYWLKFPAEETLTLTGNERVLDTVEVVAGWNLIGGVTYTVQVADIIQMPTGIVQSSYYGYEPPYAVKENLAPGGAYWVKVSEPGKLVLPAIVPPQPPARAIPGKR